MRMIDLKCTKCEHITIDHLQRSREEALPACECGAAQERVFLPTGRDNVHQDSIEGGVLISNGLCNADGTPRRYYSKTEIAREAAKRGMTNYVRHVPSKSSDKAPKGNTSRWI